ncbi:MAG: transketolase family protein [Candidatus Rokubacteria bacterium]|nr:transketolase family protein [Candidatus Rokubacteria bacterium]
MPAKATRVAFGEAILELAAKNKRIVVVNADLGKSTMTQKFAEVYPGRAFNVGVAEANLIGIGAGLALSGWIPFICTFACFVIGRFETIRLSISYSHANVKIVGTHTGLGIGEDGYSQMGMEDLTLARALPNLAIIQPADEVETKQAVAYAAEHDGPVYLRFTRQALEPVSPTGYTFQFGKGTVLREGTDVTILGTGGPLFNCLQAADRLAAEGIRAEVINISTLKPLDEELILRSGGKTGHVVTVEDHTIRGGLGGAVAELLSEARPVPLKRLGVQGFGESGDPRGLYAKHGLDPDGIARSVMKFLNR